MRLDLYLVNKNLVSSRNKANELIKCNLIKIDGRVINKASFNVLDNPCIEILKDNVFVSRAGDKLESYIKNNNLIVANLDVLDIGSSKGGFTQVLLKYGARSITCVDIGKDQLDSTLRLNPKIRLFESCDIKNFTSNFLFDFIVCDVSFVSIVNILDSIYRLSKSEVLLLFKPQFEVGKFIKRTKKGVIKDKNEIKYALDLFLKRLDVCGFIVLNIEFSMVKGKEGNEEIFIHIKKK